MIKTKSIHLIDIDTGIIGIVTPLSITIRGTKTQQRKGSIFNTEADKYFIFEKSSATTVEQVAKVLLSFVEEQRKLKPEDFHQE